MAAKNRSTLTAKEKKLFPFHPPLFHVQLELSIAHGTLEAFRKVLLASGDDFAPESEHWLTAFRAMVEKGCREIERTENLLAAATLIFDREKADPA